MFRITIDKDRVVGGLSSYIFLFTDTCETIPDGFWGRVGDADGLDIRFYDTDGVTELKREIALFSVANKQVEAWVIIPTLFSLADKVIWCSYGGATVANSPPMWYTDLYAPVACHMQTIKNSAKDDVNSRDLLNASCTAVDGKIHGAYHGRGYPYIEFMFVGRPSTYDFAAGVSVSFWVKFDQIPADYRSIVSCMFSGNSGWSFFIRNVGGVSENFFYLVDVVNHGKLTKADNSVPLIVGMWYYYTGTYDPSTGYAKLYLNGKLAATSVMVRGINPTDTDFIELLCAPDYESKRVAAALDEVRVFTYCRNAEAIATEYANQFDPQTFYHCGPEISAISDFVGSPIAGVVDLSVQFTDLSVGNATSWLWDFGDGNGSSEQNPIHVYDDAGIYTVSLAVSGSIGGADTMIKTAYVTAYGVKVVANPLSGPVPLSVRFNSEFTLP